MVIRHLLILLAVVSLADAQTIRRRPPTYWTTPSGGSAPDVPTLSSPVNFAVEQDSNNLTFSWDAATGATTYQIQIDDDPAFGSTFKDSSGITGTSASFSGLTGRTFYYWHVRATNGYGSSSYSLKWELKTKTYNALCSTAPTYLGFGIGFTDSASVLGSGGAQTPTVASMKRGDLMVVYCLDRANVTFSVTSNGGQVWTAGDDVGTTANSQLFWTIFNGVWATNPYFSTSGTSTPFSTTASVFRPCDTTHAWGLSANEASATFTAPSAPYRMIAPSITTGKANSVVLSFRATQDDNSDTNNVRVPGSNLMTRSGPEIGVQNVGGSDTYMSTWYKIYTSAGATGADTVYQSNRGGDAGVRSKIAFYDSALALPSAVTLTGPTDTQTGVSLNPTFTWSSGAIYGFVSDRIQIDSVGTGFTALTKDSSITSTGGTASFGGLTASKTYYWRVRRTNYRGTSAWSSTFSFTTGTGGGVAVSDDFNSDPSSRWSHLWNSFTWNTTFVATTGSGSYSIYNTTLGSATQYVKCQAIDTFNSFGIVMRSTGTGSDGFYVIFTSTGGTTYISRANNTGWLADETSGSFALSSTDYIGITIQGTGTGTTVKCWLNPTANAPTDKDNWDSGSDPADLTLTLSGGAGAYYDTGTYCGIGADGSGIDYDNFYAGSIP